MGQFSMEISGCAGSALSGNQHLDFLKARKRVHTQPTPIEITRVTKLSTLMLAKSDFSITIQQQALPPFDGPYLVNIQPIASYEKKYPCDVTFFEDAPASERM